jgi:hypothetical protein
MLPTFLAPDANDPTGDPIDDPVKWVINAGRVDVPIAASKSFKAWSLPSHLKDVGFHFISPTTETGLLRKQNRAE